MISIRPPKVLSEKDVKHYLRRHIFELRMRRLLDVFFKGWLNAGRLAKWNPIKLLIIWKDMMKLCYKSFISRQVYAQRKVCYMNNQQRNELCWNCFSFHTSKERALRWNWMKEYYLELKFLAEYSSIKYETSPRMVKKKREAYRKRYNMGENNKVNYDVEISRQHFYDSTITVGNNIIIPRKVDIDYTGGLIIGDNVALSEGVKILTHNHDVDYKKNNDITHGAIPTPLTICDRVSIGTKALIMPGVQEIGRGAFISSGAVVRKKVPPYAIVMGNPSKIVGFRYTPEQILELEEEEYPAEERLPEELLVNNYKKYYLDRLKEIGEFLK